MGALPTPDHDFAKLADAFSLAAAPTPLPDPAGDPFAPFEGSLGNPFAPEAEPRRPAPAWVDVTTDAPVRAPHRLALGELLVERGACEATAIEHAISVQQRTGGRLGRIITHLGIASPDEVADAIAIQRGLPHLAGEIIPAEDAVNLIPEPTCRRLVAVPVEIREHRLIVATDDPDDAEILRSFARHTALPIDFQIATREQIFEALRSSHRAAQTELSIHGLLNRDDVECAHTVLCGWQQVAFAGMSILAVVLLVIAPQATVMVAGLLSMAFYTSFAIFKIWSVTASLGHEAALRVTAEEAAAIPERDLPTYTVLVPLYKEHQVLPQLVRGLAELDYPTARLDVKLLLEEDDAETVEVARAMGLPSFIDIVVTPDSQPKTKPKSCNYGMLYARGEFTVIFDAEDIPEQDQLRKAVAAFRKAPPNVVCLQGQLNYFNRSQNMLTKWFTGEYSGWFDLFVPGLDNLNMPIPLGGTSNHFVTDVLVQLGAWDPFNVTEDADLGIRLAHAGYKTAALESTTFEEANSETFNWIRQRSRWVKGYIQTWLVHMRRPIHMIRGVGFRHFLGFQLVIGGTFFVFLFNPMQWLILLLWLLTQANVVRELFPSGFFYAAWVTFLFGNFAFVYINLLAVMRRSYWDLVGSAILSPLYWGLMSIAAWRGLIQLITAPSYWEKTEHGLDGGAHAAATTKSKGLGQK